MIKEMNKTTVTLGITFFVLFATIGCTNNQTKNHNTAVEQQQEGSISADTDASTETEEHNSGSSVENENSNTSTEEHISGTPAEAQAPQEQTANQSSNVASAADEPSRTIPLFTFYKVKSGISFDNRDIAKGRKSVFILFDPSCHHCRKEASELGKNYNKIKDINIYFVSMNDPALMASFLETFARELVGKPNIEVLYDRNQEFIQKFHVPKQFPANYVFSKDGQLEIYWDGERDINAIIAAYTK